MQLRVVSLKYTSVSEVRAAFIITAMKAVRTSETSVYLNKSILLRNWEVPSSNLDAGILP
jgi:hypothetical protein